MHASLAFIAGVLVVIGALLIFSVFSGVAFYGVALEVEAALAVIALVIAAIAVWMFYIGVKAQYSHVKTGKEALIGAMAVAVTDLKPTGEVRVMGEFWQATAKGTVVLKGQTVEVIDMTGMFLVVKPVEEKA
jgi:membrane-bound serine protease (ClpP class)